MTSTTPTTTPTSVDLPERKRNPFFRGPAGGRVLSAMMLPLFWLRPPAGFGVLTTTGRRTGKQRHKCIHVIRDGQRAFVVMIRPTPAAIASKRIAAWVLNTRANPDVRLRIAEGAFSGRARELSDPGEREAAVETYCRAVNPFDYVECVFHRGGLPSRAKIADLHRSWFEHGVALVIELEDV
ncbi:MAG TPA: nitroreductase/quinone reductase family protein [Solirubrobacteraceae bacterium]|jgi:deazaflavin-dependent oxidoreductase (nitroreductase family)|nr:nitroreductase/quinone reductase family protein [Solirubrobacteraceae bacterium]